MKNTKLAMEQYELRRRNFTVGKEKDEQFENEIRGLRREVEGGHRGSMEVPRADSQLP